MHEDFESDYFKQFFDQWKDKKHEHKRKSVYTGTGMFGVWLVNVTLVVCDQF